MAVGASAGGEAVDVVAGVDDNAHFLGAQYPLDAVGDDLVVVGEAGVGRVIVTLGKA